MAISLSVIGLFCAINLASAQVVTNQAVNAGEAISLQCETTHANPADWFRRSPGSEANQQVSMGRDVVGTLRGRAVVEFRQGEYCNLKINKAEKSDTGVYTCIEDGGVGPKSFTVRLDVLESSVEPTSVSGYETTEEYNNSTLAATDADSVPLGVIIVIVAVVGVVVLLVVIVIIIIVAKHSRQSATSEVKEKRPLVEEMPGVTVECHDQEKSNVLQPIAQAEVTTINSLSVKDMKVVLEKTYRMMIADDKSKYRENYALTTLLNVSRWWFQIIIERDAKERIQPTWTIGLPGEVVGVACLENKVYVLFKMSNEIKLGQCSQPAFKLQAIDISKIRGACDIIAWDTTKLVYVADSVNSCIWSIASANVEEKRSKLWSIKKTDSGKETVKEWWNRKKNGGKSQPPCIPCCLSTCNDRMFVSTSDHKLLVLNQKGEAVGSYLLNKCVDPQHVIATPFGGVVLSTSRKNSPDPLIVHKNEGDDIGLTKNIFPLRSSFHVTFDRSEQGFLSIFKRDCIFLVNAREIRKCNVVLSAHVKADSLDNPGKLSFMETTKELFVCNRQKVKIYKMKPNYVYRLPRLAVLDADYCMTRESTA